MIWLHAKEPDFISGNCPRSWFITQISVRVIPQPLQSDRYSIQLDSFEGSFMPISRASGIKRHCQLSVFWHRVQITYFQSDCIAYIRLCQSVITCLPSCHHEQLYSSDVAPVLDESRGFSSPGSSPCLPRSLSQLRPWLMPLWTHINSHPPLTTLFSPGHVPRFHLIPLITSPLLASWTCERSLDDGICRE
jgi:hypothetical protein